MRIARIACVLCSSAAFAFQPSTPPMKMGLWEMTTNMTMKATGKMADAMQKSGQAMGTPTTQSLKLCLTMANWQKAVSGQMHPGCQQSNVLFSGQKYSLTITCNHGDNNMVVDSTTVVDSPVQMHGTAHLVSNSSMGQMISDSTSTGKFLSADCGDVKPIGGAGN